MNNFLQVFGLVCPFTGKIRFVEMAKNAAIAYENYLKSSALFTDEISSWINILKEKGVKPGFALLDSKASNGKVRKLYWEKYYGIKKAFLIKKKSKKSKYHSREKKVNEESKYTQRDSSEQSHDSE